MSNGHGHGPQTPPGVRFARALVTMYRHGLAYTVGTVIVFILSLVFLAYLDLLPEAPRPEIPDESPLVIGEDEESELVKDEGELPKRIEIPAIGLKVNISNPTTTDIATLDKYLLSGAVRYPTSAKVGAAGNAVLFGHSSYLPVVSNRNFRAFNGIQKLSKGDTITVYGEDKAYTYEVETVVESDAESGAIPLNVEGAKLTLATCDSFGEKTDRFIVTAVLVDSRVI